MAAAAIAAPSLNKAEMIARAEALVPMVAARAAETDARRAVPDDLIAAMIDAELFATIAPRDYGGFEIGLDTYSEIVRRISAASPSTGWVTAFLMGAAWRVQVGRDHVLTPSTNAHLVCRLLP